MLWHILTWPWRRAQWLSQARPIRFTRFGWLYISFSLAVGAAAINTGNNLLYLILGLLLGFIVISGFLSDSCLWGLDIDLQVSGDLYAGQPAEWDMTASKNWFPGMIIRIEAFWQERVTRHLFYWIPRYGSQRLRFSFTPAWRGLLSLEKLRYSTRFPFGLFEKSHTHASSETWVVFPRVTTLPLDILHAAGVNTSDEPVGRKGQGATPFDLRLYQRGDSSKRIHWKSSAKRGRLMVAEMEEESAAGQRLRVSQWPLDSELEPFIAFVASLIYTLYLQGQAISLLTPGIALEPDRSRTQLKRILTYLALLDAKKEKALKSPAAAMSRQDVDVVAVWKKAGRTHG